MGKRVFNWSFIAHFVGGMFCFFRVYRIMDGQKVMGTLGGFEGTASVVNAVLLVGVGIYLIASPFRKKNTVTWLDILSLIVLLIFTDIVPTLIS